MTQNTLFYGFYVDGSKIITYAIGEHDPGSAQKGRKSSQMKSPGSKDAEVKMRGGVPTTPDKSGFLTLPFMTLLIIHRIRQSMLQ